MRPPADRQPRPVRAGARLGDLDAGYVATPNRRHAEFAVAAPRAGLRVLCEKALEVFVTQARAVLEAARASSAKLMVAYRLHFQPATPGAIQRVRGGEGRIVADDVGHSVVAEGPPQVVRVRQNSPAVRS